MPVDRTTLRSLAALALLGGGGLVAWAIALGQAEVGVFLVFPFLVGRGPVALAGLVLLFVGFTGLFSSFALGRRVPGGGRDRWRGRRSDRDAGADHGRVETASPPEAGEAGTGDRRVEGGGVILIGPVPIVFGSDRRWATLAALGGLLLVLGLIVVVLLARA